MWRASSLAACAHSAVIVAQGDSNLQPLSPLLRRGDAAEIEPVTGDVVPAEVEPVAGDVEVGDTAEIGAVAGDVEEADIAKVDPAIADVEEADTAKVDPAIGDTEEADRAPAGPHDDDTVETPAILPGFSGHRHQSLELPEQQVVGPVLVETPAEKRRFRSLALAAAVSAALLIGALLFGANRDGSVTG